MPVIVNQYSSNNWLKDLYWGFTVVFDLQVWFQSLTTLVRLRPIENEKYNVEA